MAPFPSQKYLLTDPSPSYFSSVFFALVLSSVPINLVFPDALVPHRRISKNTKTAQTHLTDRL